MVVREGEVWGGSRLYGISTCHANVSFRFLESVMSYVRLNLTFVSSLSVGGTPMPGCLTKYTTNLS